MIGLFMSVSVLMISKINYLFNVKSGSDTVSMFNNTLMVLLLTMKKCQNLHYCIISYLY